VKLGGATFVAALALVSVTGPATAATTSQALIARWTAATHQPARRLQTSAPVATPPGNLQALAARELATPGRYQLATVAPRPVETSLWTRLWTWLLDRWKDLWQATYGRAHLGRGGAVAIGDLLIAAVALLLLLVTLRLLTTLVLERRSRAATAEPLALPADAPALYAAACERARHGEYARASQFLFAATIASLSGRGLVHDDRSATVGEFQRALRRDDAALVAPFDAVSSAFVIGAYAERPVDAPDWERARQAYLSLAGRVEA